MLLETKVKIYGCCHSCILEWWNNPIHGSRLGSILVCKEGYRTSLNQQGAVWVRIENRFARTVQTHWQSLIQIHSFIRKSWSSWSVKGKVLLQLLRKSPACCTRWWIHVLTE
jgi:hypothetical protein